MHPLLAFWLLLPATLSAARTNTESSYRDKIADQLKGTTEVVLEDRTRCDIITEQYAIEVDFADKWAEAIGQSLHYAALTNKQAAITLIIEKPSDMKQVFRTIGVIQDYQLPITLFIMKPDQCIQRLPLQ